VWKIRWMCSIVKQHALALNIQRQSKGLYEHTPPCRIYERMIEWKQK